MKTNEEKLDALLARLDSLNNIKIDEIPKIDLYMDQVTTFMDTQLKSTKRHQTDKLLTKTMINNYAKNDLLPPPLKKKYSKEHVLVLIFIYYFKNILSINDIQGLLKPITEQYFAKGSEIDLESIYNEVFRLEPEQLEKLKEDVIQKYRSAETTFENTKEEDSEFLHLFSFICMLSFDVYVKKLIIEKLIDQMRQK